LLSLKEEIALQTTRAMELLARLKAAEGAACEATWAELRAVVLEKAKLAAAEWRRLETLQGVVTVEQALLFARALLAAARETVKDPTVLRRLQERCLALLPPDDTGRGYTGIGYQSGAGHAQNEDAGAPTSTFPPSGSRDQPLAEGAAGYKADG
jgi:hypothetical protein